MEQYLCLSLRHVRPMKLFGALLLLGPFALAAADFETGTIRITALFPNPGNILRPGQYAKARFKVQDRTGALLIPQRAVQELQGKNFVWVVDDANKVSQRGVTVGQRFGSDWVIEEGLKPGERIVVEGLQKVREGAPVQPLPAQPASQQTAKE